MRNTVALENLVERGRIEEIFGPDFQLFARRSLHPSQVITQARTRGYGLWYVQGTGNNCVGLVHYASGGAAFINTRRMECAFPSLYGWGETL